MNPLTLRKVIGMIPKLSGSKGAMTLSAEQLKFMAKEDKGMSKVLGTLDKPSLEIAYKAKSNYSVAALRLKDGEKSVAKGAVSIQNPNTPNTIIKYRSSIGENANIAHSNGYVDFGKKIDIEDFEIFAKSKKGVVSASATSNKAIGVAAEINEKPAVEFLEKIQPGLGHNAVAELSAKLQNSKAANLLEEGWNNLRRFVSGDTGKAAVKTADQPKKAAVKDFKEVKGSDTQKYMKTHAKKPKNAKLAALRKEVKGLQDSLAEVEKEYTACKDLEAKSKLATKYNEELADLSKKTGILKEKSGIGDDNEFFKWIAEA